MAEEEKKYAGAVASKKRVAVTKKTAAKKTAVKIAARKPTESEKKRTTATRKKRSASDKKVEAGFELLTDAVLEELRINGPEIVRKLVEKAMAGDTQSTKLLVAIVMEKLAAEQKTRLMKKVHSKEQAEKKVAKKRLSVAMSIEAAPEWSGGNENAAAKGESSKKQ